MSWSDAFPQGRDRREEKIKGMHHFYEGVDVKDKLEEPRQV